MEVIVNHQNKTVSEQCSVEELLQQVLKRASAGLAVAVNQTIVPKVNWKTHLLHPGDQLVLIKATQGG